MSEIAEDREGAYIVSRARPTRLLQLEALAELRKGLRMYEQHRIDLLRVQEGAVPLSRTPRRAITGATEDNLVTMTHALVVIVGTSLLVSVMPALLIVRCWRMH